LQGVTHENIKSTIHPYFERFININKKISKNYYKALILSPDYYSMCPTEKIGSELWFYVNVIKLLKELDIKIIGIKSRFNYNFKKLGEDGHNLTVEGVKIPLISGYSDFPKIAQHADLIIGPASTAIIEAGLMGKDYYVFQHTPFYKYTPSMLPQLYSIVNTSYDFKDLKKNINLKKCFKRNFTVSDLANINGINSKEILYKKFNNDIYSLLK